MDNNIFFELEAEFLKAPLNAKYFYKDKANMGLIGPQNVEEPGVVKIKELMEKLGGNTSTISVALGDNVDSMEPRLSMAYLRYLRMEDEAAPAEKEGGQESAQSKAEGSMEYALKVELDNFNASPVFDKIGDIKTVNKVTIAVNTSDTTVTDKMDSAIPAFTTKVISK